VSAPHNFLKAGCSFGSVVKVRRGQPGKSCLASPIIVCCLFSIHTVESRLRKQNEALALGYVAARIVEGVLFIVAVLAILTLWTLSQKYVEAGAPDASYFQTLGELLLAVRYWAYNVLWPVIIGLGSLMFYYLLYQSKLIPRWLSVWGLIGAPLFPVSWLSLFGPKISGPFLLPLVANEMVLAVWLIVKGFNSLPE
jgi:hypothetical protein